MTKRRRTVYLGLMAVGGMALAVDRCVLSDGVITPEQAMALDPSRVPVRQASQTLTAATSPVPVVPFPSGIPPFDPESPLRDIFSPSSNEGGVTAVLRASDKRGANLSGHVTSQVFTMTHRLFGVLLYDGLKIAIVDGLWLRIGEHMDGCALESIEGNKACFRCGDERALLRVADNPTLTTD